LKEQQNKAESIHQ